MTSLTDLPTEILDSIISQLLHQYLHNSFPRNCLIDLSFVSRRLNRLTNLILYQSVYYRSDYDQGPVTPGETSLEAPYLPPTRIFHLGYFSRTLESSPALRALVHHVDISWSWKSFSIWTEYHLSRVLLQLHTSARSMHLEPLRAGFPVSRYASLTSVSLTYSRAYQGYDSSSPWVSLNRICLIPTLRRLSLSLWPLSELEPTFGEAEAKSRCSNITHLSLYRSEYPWPVLEELLTWPKALESFILHSYPFEALDNAQHQRYSPAELLDYLRPQRDSLESLFLTIISNKWEANNTHNGDGSTIRDFSDFYRLKRLCVSRELLGFPSGFPRQAFEIRIALPPQIEQFHVNIQFSGNWGQLQSMDRTLSKPLASGVFGVLDCLQHIVLNKALEAPRLRRIVIYYGTYSKARRLFADYRAIPPRKSERARMLASASAAVGVKLVFWTHWRRPLWDDWLSSHGLC